jgi:hypothetical protein
MSRAATAGTASVWASTFNMVCVQCITRAAVPLTRPPSMPLTPPPTVVP